jgi:hypothetical protein
MRYSFKVLVETNLQCDWIVKRIDSFLEIENSNLTTVIMKSR